MGKFTSSRLIIGKDEAPKDAVQPASPMPDQTNKPTKIISAKEKYYYVISHKYLTVRRAGDTII